MTHHFNDVGVILAAGGSSQRFGIPKLWVDLAGRPVFAHSLDLFLQMIPAMQIVLSVPRAEFERYQDYIEKHYPQHIIPLIVGGATRTETVRKGLAALPDSVRCVAIHDAARPLLTKEMFTDAVGLCKSSGDGAIICTATTDTIKRLNPDGTVAETLPRAALVNVQTPQVFPLEKLRKAYAELPSDMGFSDDSSVYEHAGYTVRTIITETPNPKITHAHDWELIKILSAQQL